MTRKKIKHISDNEEEHNSDESDEVIILPKDDSNDIYYIYMQLLDYCDHLIIPLLDKSTEYAFYKFVKH